MVPRARRSRWNVGPRPGSDGRPEGFLLVPSDLDICRLLAHRTGTRRPWAYPYLPTTYIAPLLGRGAQSVPKRLRKLADWGYLTRPDQPRSNCREIVYALAPKGAAEVRADGHAINRLPRRQLAHQLMAAIIAASFELAGIERADIRFEPGIDLGDIGLVPDWPPFRLTTPYRSQIVFIEADLASERLEGGTEATTIAGKLDRYLAAIHHRRLGDAVILFVATRPTRMASMVELLKRVIDRNGYPHDFAEPFAFAHIGFDRFLTSIPKLTDWAVSEPHHRAGFPPLRLLAP